MLALNTGSRGEDHLETANPRLLCHLSCRPSWNGVLMGGEERSFSGIKPVSVFSPQRRGELFALLALAGAFLFLVYPTPPLFSGNQNTKFLHGMA